MDNQAGPVRVEKYEDNDCNDCWKVIVGDHVVCDDWYDEDAANESAAAINAAIEAEARRQCNEQAQERMDLYDMHQKVSRADERRKDFDEAIAYLRARRDEYHRAETGWVCLDRHAEGLEQLRDQKGENDER